MISYNLTKFDTSRKYGYSRGWRTADTNDPLRIAECMRRFTWSPIVWKDGIRSQENFVRADWLALDFDDGEMTLGEAKQLFSDTIHLIGTTKSHQKPKHGWACDRFRVVILFEEPIFDLRIYRWNIECWIKRHPVDSLCKDGARMFYPCTEIVQLSDEGFRQEVFKDIPRLFEGAIDRTGYGVAGVLPPFSRKWLQSVIPLGKRNGVIYYIAKDMVKAGYSVQDVLSLVVNSPTYIGKVGPSLLKEIQAAIASGAKRARIDMEANE